MSSLDHPYPLAFVTTELRHGGAERNLIALATGLNREHFAPHVYSLAPRPPAGEDQLIMHLDDAGVGVTFINVEHAWQIFTAVRRLRRLLSERPPRLVQSFLYHANVVAALAARGMKAPVVAGLRVAQHQRLRNFVEGRLTSRIDAFVCVSQGVADVAMQQDRLPREKLHVIPNGVDPRRFADVTPADLSQYGITPEQNVVLFAGRLDHQKGVDVLLDAAAQFLPKLPDAILLIVGDGPDEAILKAQAASGPWKQQVVFLHRQADVLPLIAAADVVAFPSRWEGMSNVLMEAVALARPVAATDVEGVRDVLGEARARRWIVPAADPAALAEVVQELLSTSAEIREIAAANRQHLYDQFPLKHTIAAYARLYESLIAPWEGI